MYPDAPLFTRLDGCRGRKPVEPWIRPPVEDVRKIPGDGKSLKTGCRVQLLTMESRMDNTVYEVLSV
jgi:hypothetical protein